MSKNITVQTGFSLIEVVIALASVGFLVLLIGNIPTSVRLVTESRHQSTAREILTKQIEDKRQTTYANLADGTQSITDPRLTSLPNSSGTILVEACPVSVCTQGENAKQITVSLSWKEGSKSRSASIKTIIAEGGLNQ